MSRLDFFKRHYDESTVLKRALAHTKHAYVRAVIEVLYFNPDATPEQVKQAAGVLSGVDLEEVRSRFMPQAQHWIDLERARNTPAKDTVKPKEARSRELAPATPNEVTGDGASLDEMEEQAITLVQKANTRLALDNRLKQWTITIFKTFGPYAVLALTIPESFWVFSRLYAHLDTSLEVMTWLFATLVDLGYTTLTVLLAMNKEAMQNRLRAGLEIEAHEHKAVRLQSVIWWFVAGLDILAQASFLLAATQGEHAYTSNFVLVLIGARIFSLFLTMFIVSFAGTELMTPIDRVTNEQVERAVAVKKVMGALGEARAKRVQAQIELEQALDAQELLREGNKLLAEIYSDARSAVRAKMGGDNHKLN
ncbi:MAG: hypothetical protein WCD86_03805 [Ktedonobacteraceae bacterium]